MLIELWRKVLGTDYSGCSCAICGNDFDRGSVFPVAFTDCGKAEIGEVCPHCLAHLNRRKRAAEDPTLGNWPARGWPTLRDLEEARARYPEPMFADAAQFEAEAPGWEAEEDALAASVIWAMEPEDEAREPVTRWAVSSAEEGG